MKDRIQKIIEFYNLTSNSFAQEIEVNRSTISHILTGRNKPSIEVVQKTLKRFNAISSDWLLLGNGNMEISNNHKVQSNNSIVANPTKEVEKIIVVYSDQTFKEYKPS
jgi:DNA-binding XRE family transcriptional regulator